MNRPRSIAAFLLLAVLCVPAVGSSKDKPAKRDPRGVSDLPPGKLSDDDRVTLIRGLQSEHAFMKIALPMGKKGVTITKEGQLSPGLMKLQQLVAREGPAAREGDRVQITNFLIEGNKLIFEINGGPRKGPKWYNRIEIYGMGGGTQVKPMDPRVANARGSVVVLEFKGDVPRLSVDEVKKLLSPVFDFTPMSQAEAYQSTLPKIVQDAIKDHRVLVGMDREMVIYAVGRPGKKYRDKDDKGVDYEEWIYGTPPQEVQFVRFLGNEVARLEIMTVDGQKVIKTQREFELAVKKRPQEEAQAKPKTPAKKPTLLGPGEQAPDRDNRDHPSSIPPMGGQPSDGTPTPGHDPQGGQIGVPGSSPN